MPSGIADFGSETWVSSLFGVIPIIEEYFIALCKEGPGVGADGDVVAEMEPSGGYSRQSYLSGPSNWAANGNYIVNLNDIDFGSPTDDWGLITHFALLDAATEGNLFAFGEFQTPQYVSTSYRLIVPGGAIVISLSSLESSISV